MLTNIDLENLTKKLNIPLICCVPKDKIPFKKDRKDGLYILNLQDDLNVLNQENRGSHWVAMYVEKNQGCYFDSFGFAPPRQVEEFLSDLRPIPYNNKQIQDINSSYCGYYVLFFGWFMINHKKIKKLTDRLQRFTDLFSLDTKQNENILKNYLKFII